MEEAGKTLNSRRKAHVWDMVFLGGFFLVLCLCLWKAPLEIQRDDEAFYLTIPKRLLDGDVFIVDEWHVSQFSAFLLLPLIWLDRLIFGFEGILLRFRFYYVFFQAICTVVIFLRLRKDYGAFGVMASLFFFLFTPYDIMALSYNTMGLMLGALTGVMLATAKSRAAYYVGGALFAGAVLCCPYLCVGYILFSVIILIFAWVRKSAAAARNWFIFSAGCGTLAAVLVAFILSRTSLQQFIESLPFLFTDPEHQSKGLFSGLYGYVCCIRDASAVSPYGIYIYGAAVVAALLDRRRSEHCCIYMCIAVAAAAVLLLGFIPWLSAANYNAIMFPFLTVGVMAYLTAEKKNHRMFLFTVMGGVIYSVCIFFTSNQGLHVVSMILTIANIGSMVLLKNVWTETKDSDAMLFSHVFRAAVCILFVIQFSMMVYTKTTHMYWSSARPSELTQTIEAGPYKGIRVTEETKNAYEHDLSLLEPLADKTGSVLYMSEKTWYYLATPELKIGTYSTWLSLEGDNSGAVMRMMLYYARDKNRLPTYVFIPAEEEQNNGPLRQQILERYDYQKLDYDGAALYSRVG